MKLFGARVGLVGAVLAGTGDCKPKGSEMAHNKAGLVKRETFPIVSPVPSQPKRPVFKNISEYLLMMLKFILTWKKHFITQIETKFWIVNRYLRKHIDQKSSH